MNNEKVELKALTSFRQIHNELNDYVKLATIGIDFLSSFSSDEKALSSKISSLIENAGERWIAWEYTEPLNTLVKVRNEISASGIIRVYSAFEVFSDEVISLANLNPDSEEFSEEKNLKRVSFLFRKNNWPEIDIDYLLPLYNFYTTCRNCIAHRMGRASKLLEKQLKSNEFISAMENWPTVKERRKLSDPPAIRHDGLIEFRPHHAITYSDVCYRLASVINRNVAKDLGLKYFLKKIINKRLLDSDKLNGLPGKDLYSYLRRHLEQDYKFDNVKQSDMRTILEETEVRKKCLAKYRALSI